MYKFQKIFFNNKKILKKNYCVLCFSRKLHKVLDFDKTPLANSYKKYLNLKQIYFKLSCVICSKCGHLQLSHLVNPKIMFEDYLYVSGTSNVLKKHFIDYAKKIISNFKLSKNSKILDIACNDGTFLEYFKKQKFKNVVGVEPAKNLRILNIKKKIDINTNFFSKAFSDKMKNKYDSFDIITANNVFAHSPDLYDFSQGVKNILSPKGVFILEVSYLGTVLKKKTFDTIYHEHMSYHGLKPLIQFFKNQNLEIFDFELIEAQGGSIRIYISHKNSFILKKNKIEKQIKKEVREGLYSKKRYKLFFKEITDTKIKLNKIIKDLKKKNLDIIGYGAPAKLTTLTHVFNLTRNDFKIVIDDNSLKVNKFTPGKNFLIKNFNYLKKNKLKYKVIIILAWNFYDSIKKKCKKINNKFLFISPFPRPRIDR
jgi:2-polyprenyl-3-methyl-5-hydroxy-6-metoxy-1,4-benzoquinol methylase